MPEQPKDTRIVRIKDVVEIYKDPETEEHIEGYAKVWEVMAKDDTFYTLIVSFLGDPHERRVERKYRVKSK